MITTEHVASSRQATSADSHPAMTQPSIPLPFPSRTTQQLYTSNQPSQTNSRPSTNPASATELLSASSRETLQCSFTHGTPYSRIPPSPPLLFLATLSPLFARSLSLRSPAACPASAPDSSAAPLRQSYLPLVRALLLTLQTRGGTGWRRVCG